MRRLTNLDECNILLGQLLHVKRVTVDLPAGYAGMDYCKDWKTLRYTLEQIHKNIEKNMVHKMQCETGGNLQLHRSGESED